MTIVRDILDLIKVRILFSALLTTVLGYFLAVDSASFDVLFLFWLCLGLGFIFSSAAAINHVMEVGTDALMDRTQNRPLVKKRISLLSFWIGVLVLLLFGTAILYIKFNLMVLVLSLFILIFYDVVYTPLKKITVLNTWIGAFPGAMPVLCGWFSVRDDLDFLIIVIFSIYYWWQLPHFFAIAWMNKESYLNAGLKMMSVDDKGGHKTAFHLCLSTFIFLVFLTLPFFFNYVGYIYFIPLMGLSILFCYYIFLFCIHKTVLASKKILFCSILYPPLILLFIVLDSLV
ncbi:protoheme IX farnesyltransferase [Candidatus Marinamargulisbacteria bacterium SCGC AG-343-D04]|nr:protoheme IX farnesyltransferase [Candidatus Marinamargulisbacteria bacterium SCGC AG-343-D04]